MFGGDQQTDEVNDDVVVDDDDVVDIHYEVYDGFPDSVSKVGNAYWA